MIWTSFLFGTSNITSTYSVFVWVIPGQFCFPKIICKSFEAENVMSVAFYFCIDDETGWIQRNTLYIMQEILTIWAGSICSKLFSVSSGQNAIPRPLFAWMNTSFSFFFFFFRYTHLVAIGRYVQELALPESIFRKKKKKHFICLCIAVVVVSLSQNVQTSDWERENQGVKISTIAEKPNSSYLARYPTWFSFFSE